MAVTLYTSDDVGAPVLRGGTAGDLIALLDACLVTGYGDRPAAGWTKPFVGTNKAVFKTGVGSNGFNLRVDDSQTITTSAPRWARAVGYEAMTDVDTGTGKFPSDTQLAGGLYWHTSQAAASAAATPIPWTVVADHKFMYLWLNSFPQNSSSMAPTPYYQCTFCFGDTNPFKAGDQWATLIAGAVSAAAPGADSGVLGGSAISSARAGLFFARSHTGAGGSIYGGWCSDHNKGNTTWGSGNLSYPNPTDGGVYLAPVWIHEPGNPGTGRGTVPGLWAPCHYMPFGQGDTFDGQGDLVGRRFKARSAYSVQVVVEVSDTWR